MSNPAPDYETIFDVEGAVEDACKAILAEYRVKAFRQFEDERLPAERVDIRLLLRDQRDHASQYIPGRFVRDAWNGVLVFAVWSKRKRGADGFHRKTRARIRMGAEYFSQKFGDELLPYHVLKSITFRDCDPGYDKDDDADFSLLSYDVIVCVRDGAWPQDKNLITEDGQMLVTEDGFELTTEG